MDSALLKIDDEKELVMYIFCFPAHTVRGEQK